MFEERGVQQQALAAMVAWVRLDRAIDAFQTDLRRRHGITALQLAVLHIVSERPQIPLAALRKTLVAHPATLGQAIDALRRLGFCRVLSDPADRRARNVSLTEKGEALVRDTPLAGPMRLRYLDGAADRLDALAEGFADAIDLFGLSDWVGR